MLKVFWTYIASKRKIEEINFFDWLSNVKNQDLVNGSEHLQNVIPLIKIAFYFKKSQKNCQWLGSSRPDFQSLRWLGGRPQTPVCDTFELH